MKVVWTSPALNDLDEIQDFVALESPASAHRLVNDIMDRTERLLATNPRAGRIGRVVGTFEFVLSGTAYIVAYQLKSDVEILAVVHGARRWPETFS